MSVQSVGRAASRPLGTGAETRPSRQREGADDHPDEYAFLSGKLIDEATLARARELSRRWGVTPRQVMIAQGWLSPADYARAVADHFGRESLARIEAVNAASPKLATTPHKHRAPGPEARLRRPADVKQALSALAENGSAAPAVGAELRQALTRNRQKMLIAEAVHGLARRFPQDCALGGLSRGQKISFICAGAALLFGLLAETAVTLRVLAGLSTVFFAMVAGLRTLACGRLLVWTTRAAPRNQASRIRLRDADLPIYSVLVPLYGEATVLPALVAALMRIDYPAAKLDIKLVLESVDGPTLRAARAIDLPGNIEIIVVPEGGPRTKPKALNYALRFARGEFVAIYDAEDRPDPAQLRRALDTFKAEPDVACVQALLNFYNPTETWLANGIRAAGVQVESQGIPLGARL